MVDLLAFLEANATLLIAVFALAISLRAIHVAQLAHRLNVQNTQEARRIKLAERKRETLNELDRQHTLMASLEMVTAHKIMLFSEYPALQATHAEEFDRLKSNLSVVRLLRSQYEAQRHDLEQIGPDGDLEKQEALLANIRRLTIHIEKDIKHETEDLDYLRSQSAAGKSAA